MHVHTHYSLDGLITRSEVKRVIKLHKVDAIAITDHNKISAWNDFSDLMIIRGVEKTIVDGNEKFDLLIYFLNEEIKSSDFYEIIDAVREQDAFTSLAHPFDFMRNAPQNIGKYALHVDALECFNSRVSSLNINQKAKDYAKSHNLLMTAGSDAHIQSELGNAYVEADATDIEEFRKLLEDGNVRVCGKLSPFYVHLYSSLRKKGFLEPKL